MTERRKPFWEMEREERRATLIAQQEKYPGRYQHILDLDEKYPSVGLLNVPCIGADFGPGWAPLVESCLQKLAEFDCVVTQVKQKFCRLVVYWQPPDWVMQARKGWIDSGRLGPDPELLFSEVITRIQLSSKLSLSTCEECGREAYQDHLLMAEAGQEKAGRRLCSKCKGERGKK